MICAYLLHPDASTRQCPDNGTGGNTGETRSHVNPREASGSSYHALWPRGDRIGTSWEFKRWIVFISDNMQPRSGSWNMVNKKLRDAEKIDAWAVFSLDASLPFEAAQRFAASLMNAMLKVGESPLPIA